MHTLWYLVRVPLNHFYAFLFDVLAIYLIVCTYVYTHRLFLFDVLAIYIKLFALMSVPTGYIYAKYGYNKFQKLIIWLHTFKRREGETVTLYPLCG